MSLTFLYPAFSKDRKYQCGNPLSGDRIQCVLGADQCKAQRRTGQEVGSRTGCLLCTANLQCLNSRNSWDSLIKLFYFLSLRIIHLLPAIFFNYFQMIYKAARSVFLGLQNAQDIAKGQGQVEWSLSAKLHWSIQLFERTGWRAQNGFWRMQDE